MFKSRLLIRYDLIKFVNENPANLQQKLHHEKVVGTQMMRVSFSVSHAAFLFATNVPSLAMRTTKYFRKKSLTITSRNLGFFLTMA